jgi:hypothetical protein
MVGRLLVGCFLSAALAFLLLASSGSKVEADTFKVNYSGSLSCAGLDGILPAGQQTTADDSCTAGTETNPGVTADLKTIFAIPAANPAHANFTSIDTFGVPVSWWLAMDSDIGNGAYVGTLVARSTLSILNGTCTTPYNVIVTIPLYDCSTDITDTITWDVPSGGINLTADADGNGLPDGCDHYPTHALLDPDGAGPKPALQPRARAYGYTNVIADAPPTQINFVFYSPGELTLMTAPESYMGDSLGYANFVIMDNPSAPVTPSSITEFCTPLDTTTTMLGLTAGKGQAIAQKGAHPEYTAMCSGSQIGVDDDADTVADDGCFVVTDKCYDGSGGEPIYRDVDTSGAVSAGDVRLTAVPPYAAASVVAGGDSDVGQTLVAFAANEKHRENVTVNGTYDAGEFIYRDVDTSGAVSAGDVRLTRVAPYAAGSVVAAGDADVGQTLVAFAANEKHREKWTANGVYDPADPLCGVVRSINPTVPGLYGTGSHLADAYAEGQRDKDADGFPNNMDACPYAAGTADNANGCDGCAGGACPAGQCNPLDSDCDNDLFMNRQDLCPFVADDQTDNDKDGIGKACDTDNGTKVPPNGDLVPDGPFVSDFPIAAVCIGETDTDGDGWCNSTETLLGSNPNDATKTPEFKGIDYKVVAAETPPGQAPQSCTNLSFYGTAGSVGVAVDDDGDTLANAADPDCTSRCYDKTRSEDGCAANTCGDGIDNGAACNGTGTDGKDAADPDCWLVGGTDSDADGICNNSDNCAGTAPGKDANPAQLNTDANNAMPSDADATGNACDLDDDNDGAANAAEWGHSTDATSRNGRSPFDFNLDWKVGILDVLLYKPKLAPNPYDYHYDMNLDGSVGILDVLLFKPVLNQVGVDKYDMGVFISQAGSHSPDPSPAVTTIVAGKEYSTTVTVGTNPWFTATSRENNRTAGQTVPVGSSVVHFYCDLPSTMACVWVPVGSPPNEILTTRDQFAPKFSAVAPQKAGAVADPAVKVVGDNKPYSAESALIFLSDKTEPYNTAVDFVRDFKLDCTAAGTYDVSIYNKDLPRGLYTEINPWDNESVAILHVTCVP